MKKIILLVLASATLLWAKPNTFKVSGVAANKISVTCLNGADPTISKQTDSELTVSCGASLKATWNGATFTCPAGSYVWPDSDEPLQKNSKVYCGLHPLNTVQSK